MLIVDDKLRLKEEFYLGCDFTIMCCKFWTVFGCCALQCRSKSAFHIFHKKKEKARKWIKMGQKFDFELAAKTVPFCIWKCVFTFENIFSGKKTPQKVFGCKPKKTFLLYFATLFLLLLRLTFSCKNYDKSIFRLAFGACSRTQTLFEIYNNFAFLELLYLSKIV